MSMKEIEKLRDKIDKDPNSKLYVPLAEEYREEGMLDEAVEVLLKGLERQPGYMSARVLLGKIHLEKGQMQEARAEFEQVVRSIPDNLYAHKKLAEIYRETGERDLAIKTFRSFLKLNPLDADALNSLRDLEGAYPEKPTEMTNEPVVSAAAEAAVSGDDFSAAMSLELDVQEPAQTGPAASGDELEAFKESLFGDTAEPAREMPEDLLAEEDLTLVEDELEDAEEPWSSGKETGPAPHEVHEQEIALEEDSAEETDEIWSFGDEKITQPVEKAVEDIPPAGQGTEETGDAWSFGDMPDTLRADDDLTAVEKHDAADDVLIAESTPAAAGSKQQQDEQDLLQTADRLIAEGKYFGAIDAYQRILAGAPGNKQVLQRIEELRSLLKLMGMDKEALLARLNAFLNAINKRGDEFHRRS